MTPGRWAILILLAVNGLLSASRAALVNARRPRLAELAAQHKPQAHLALTLAGDLLRLLITLRLARMLCRFSVAGLAVAVFEPTLSAWLGNWIPGAPDIARIAIIIIVVLTALTMVTSSEMLPEGLVISDDVEVWAMRLAPFVAALEWLLTPLVRPLVWLSIRTKVPLDGRAPVQVTPEEIKILIDVGQEDGSIEKEERELLYSILDFGDTLAREVMIPRIDMLALDVETHISDTLDAILDAGYSRVPVFAGMIDNVQGLIYAKDLLKVWRDGNLDRTLRELLRPAYYVPETKRLGDLLAEMQQQRIHMAIVVDEYGGVAGLVTLEDVIEEIIGEVQDEYDPVEQFRFAKTNDGNYLVSGGIDLDDLNDLLHTNLDAEDADTLAGLIYERLGKVPVAGESVIVGGLRLTVQSVVGRRIRRVSVSHLTPGDASGDSANDKEPDNGK